MRPEIYDFALCVCVCLFFDAFFHPRFDFKGNPDKDELTFEKGDFLTVFGKATAEGWWVRKPREIV